MSNAVRDVALAAAAGLALALAAAAPAIAAGEEEATTSPSPSASITATSATTSPSPSASPTEAPAPEGSDARSAQPMVWTGPGVPAGGIELPATGVIGSTITVKVPLSFAGTLVKAMLFIHSSSFSGPWEIGSSLLVASDGTVVLSIPDESWALGEQDVYVAPEGGQFNDKDELIGWGTVNFLAAEPTPTPTPEPSTPTPEPSTPAPSPTSPAPAPAPAASPSPSAQLAVTGGADTAPALAGAAAIALAAGVAVRLARRRRA